MGPRSGRKPKIFISHAVRDRAFVRRLLTVLKKNNIPFWISEKHIPGASEWHDEIGKALKSCDWFLIILSPNPVRSVWVKRELMYALHPNRYKGRIIPVYYRTCRHELLSWTLEEFQFVEFRRVKDFEAACGRLLRLWGIRRPR